MLIQYYLFYIPKTNLNTSERKHFEIRKKMVRMRIYIKDGLPLSGHCSSSGVAMIVSRDQVMHPSHHNSQLNI